MWQDWINALLGIWVIIVPYLDMTNAGLKTTLWITGLLIIILGIWGATSRASRMA